MDFESLFHRNSFIPRLTPILCLLCIASFLGINLGGENMTWEQAKIFGYLPTSSVWTGAPWSLISSTFVHIQIIHILFNLMGLWALGNVFEDELSSWRWAIFFIVSAWISSALQLLSSGDTGIGMSGVVYALFGFGWVARRRTRGFAAIMSQQTITSAMIWLVGCIIATQTGVANIGNGAHIAGLAFGAAVAGFWFVPHKVKRALSGAAAVALVAVSFVPLFWCPTSSDWTQIAARQAMQRHDLTTALYWYQRTHQLDPKDPTALLSMAAIYLQQKDTKNYERIMRELGPVTGNTDKQ